MILFRLLNSSPPPTQVSIGLDNGFSPIRRQAIIRTICLDIVNSNIRNKLQWNLKRISNIFSQENAIEIIVCEMAAILSRGRWVNATCVAPLTPTLT